MGKTKLPLERVLIVTPHYPPRRLGGTQLRAQKMAHWFMACGVSVEVVCVEEIERGQADGLAAVQRAVFEGVLVHRLSLTYTHSRSAFRWTYDHPQIEAYLSELVDARRPDLIHLISGYLVTPAAIRVGKIRGIPTVVTVTDYWFLCPRINLIRSDGRMCQGPIDALDCTRCLLSESRRYRLPEQLFPVGADLAWQAVSRSGWLTQRIPLHEELRRRGDCLVSVLDKADAVVLPTNSLRPRLLRAGVRDRFVLVRHGVDLQDLGIGSDPGALASDLFRFGYMGNLLHSKGADILVDAYCRLTDERTDASLTLWGGKGYDHRYTARLEQRVSRAPRAKLCGPFVPREIRRLLSELDVLVVPSRWPEIGPFVILEAFAAGTPVIAARIGNMPELVEHGVNGLLFEPDSVPDLTAQMRRVLDEPGLRDHLRAGITPARTVGDEMEELLAIYLSIRQASSTSRE